MDAKNATLDRVLSEIPGVVQSEPVENAEFIRFTVQLQIDPSDHHQPPEIFLLFTQSEFRENNLIPRTLETAFRRKIEQYSFKEPNGNVVQTSVRKTSSGLWHALAIDGLPWTFDTDRKQWIKDKALAA